MSDTQHSDSAIAMANAIKNWWEQHKHDTMGDYGLRNVFDREPAFVEMAKAVIGDWEKGTFTVEAFGTRTSYRINEADAKQEKFPSLEEAKAWADRKDFADFYDVVVTAQGPHPNYLYLAGEILYQRFKPEDAPPGGALGDGAGWFDVEAYRTKEHFDNGNQDVQSLDGFTAFEFAKGYAESEEFKDFYQVNVTAYGEHDDYERNEIAYSRFTRPD